MAIMYLYSFLVLLTILMILGYWLGDFTWLWNTEQDLGTYYHFNIRDHFYLGLLILPSILSHFITIWGHYYRADIIFQKSIHRVITTINENGDKEENRIGEDKKYDFSFWEKKDKWIGYTVKFWVLVFLAWIVNFAWFFQPVSNFKSYEGYSDAVMWASFIGYGGGYASMGACGMILFLVLRRSMLHAIGFTYAELLPLHRWMGVAIVFWTSIHTAAYFAMFILEGDINEEINFDGNTRGPQNILGIIAYLAVVVLSLFSIPYVRRRFYVLFMTLHRYLTIVFFVGTLMHYPYVITWYYVLPSVCLFFTDRFIPKVVQAFSVAPEVTCSFDRETDILTIVLVSRHPTEPLKPYYPGDYINLQMTSLSSIYHPFTIASYWAEDPYSMTLYIRALGQEKVSWTRALAGKCEREMGLKNDSNNEVVKMVNVHCNVDGVFGDRHHDYLGAETLVIFTAGAALTTFMALLKAIAAQIASCSSSSSTSTSSIFKRTLKVHLIGTFRTEAELYAYGSFLHQVVHDDRFKSFLSVELYVSRPNLIKVVDQETTFADGTTTIIPVVDTKNNDDSSPSNPSRPIKVDVSPFTLLHKRQDSNPVLFPTATVNDTKDSIEYEPTGADTTPTSPTTAPVSSSSSLFNHKRFSSSSSSSSSSTTTPSSPFSSHYKSIPLPTFLASFSSTTSTLHAKRDLFLTFLILIIPISTFVGMRFISWEGTLDGMTRWCETTEVYDQNMTNKCMWTYVMIPGVVHVVVACWIGYLLLWIARRQRKYSIDVAVAAAAAASASASASTAAGGGGGAGTELMEKKRIDPMNVNRFESADDQEKRMKSVYEHQNIKMDHSIPFSAGKLNIQKSILDLQQAKIGVQPVQEWKEGELPSSSITAGQQKKKNDNKNKKSCTVVLVGGPDGFLDAVTKASLETKWYVELHRETWSP